MRRLVLGLWLLLGACSAFAANVKVLITYTPGAAAAAGGVASIEANYLGQINAINAIYTASGIGITLVPVIQQAYYTAPPDSASMDAQYKWAKSNVNALRQRVREGADFHIQISNSTAAQGVMPLQPVEDANNAQAALPLAVSYSSLYPVLEWTISQMIGADTGQALRGRTYNSDPFWHGQPICVRSRELFFTPTIDNSPVPFLTGYETWKWGTAGGSGNTWQAATAQQACDANKALNGAATAVERSYAYHDCVYYNSSGSAIGATSLFVIPSQQAAPLVCNETVSTHYSDANYLYPNTNARLGGVAHDSVSKMNWAAAAVAQLHEGAKTVLARAEAGIWTAISNFIGRGPGPCDC